MRNNVHTDDECRAKILAALKSVQHTKDEYSQSKMIDAVTASDVLEQLIPLMEEAEKCFKHLYGTDFARRWEVKKQKTGHCCGLPGFNPLKGDICPPCEADAKQREKSK